MLKTIAKLFIFIISSLFIVTGICQIILYGAYYLKESTLLDNIIAVLDILFKFIISGIAIYFLVNKKDLNVLIFLSLISIGFGIYYMVCLIHLKSSLTYNYCIIDCICNISGGLLLLICSFVNRRKGRII